MNQGDGMAEVTEADREKALAAIKASSPDVYVDEYVIDGELPPLIETIAAALAEERERERLQWNPMVGRVLQVAMKWTDSGDPRLAACAQQIHAAIGGSQ